MEIIGYELHIKTHYTIGSIFTAMKSKGLDPDIILGEHNMMKLTLNHSSHGVKEFVVKYYCYQDGQYVYEMKAFTEQDMEFLKESFRNV